MPKTLAPFYPPETPRAFYAMGVDPHHRSPGGLAAGGGRGRSGREIGCGSAAGRMGRARLPPAWVWRPLASRGVDDPRVTYRRVDDTGLHITVDGTDNVLEVDTIVVCAGQEPDRALTEALAASDVPVHVVGGAREAEGLDAFRAIEEGREAGLAL